MPLRLETFCVAAVVFSFSTAAPSLAETIGIEALKGCSVEQSVEISEADDTTFLAIAICKGDVAVGLAYESAGSMAEIRDRDLGDIVDYRTLPSQAGALSNTSLGNCYREKTPIDVPVIITATWGSQSEVSEGSGLHSVLRYDAKARKIVDVDLTAVSCLQDEP